MGRAVRRVVGGELAGDARAALPDDFGLTREHLGHIAINARKNAGLEPGCDLLRADEHGRLPWQSDHSELCAFTMVTCLVTVRLP